MSYDDSWQEEYYYNFFKGTSDDDFRGWKSPSPLEDLPFGIGDFALMITTDDEGPPGRRQHDSPSMFSSRAMSPEDVDATPGPRLKYREPAGEVVEFQALCDDVSVVFNPQKLGLIPKAAWSEGIVTFGEMVKGHFQRKNNVNTRFIYKLYNALKIAEFDQFYSVYVGVEWLHGNVLRVERNAFARLLGIKAIDGSLFHHQGNFPSHGFVELTMATVGKHCTAQEIEGVDYEDVRLLVHGQGLFTQLSTEDDARHCGWENTRRKSSVKK